ncbi:cobalt ECF transporter T component CbiQ [Methanoplanus sp. FWC-SCC4]|uniref:Cobalt ECF transporter T component CbiQ n=1 Tax=Methanochimaera problematica TaxID=2609417 RepID=A0AA97FBH6_9EURY|nr:cobalt ECF transporter T component CbiQ [Methanoplanus sp. FWC-SCC4]WOF15837.1 cobalt ECF transporter T component CbiQ [Methanoplanus sp. FWC-SCC4]
MYYEFLEDIAQTNGLRNVNSAVKVLLGLGCILISVSSNSFIAPLFISISLSLIIILLAKINPGLYLKLLSVPLGFALTSIIVILFLRNSGEVIFSLPVLNTFILTITSGSINESVLVLSRLSGGMCSLYFLALTTPMTEMFLLAKKIHVPDVFIDLSMIIYRFIFVLIEEAGQIYSAQTMRLGYGNFKESINTFGMMAGSLFINSWNKGENLINAMETRCYDGKFAMLEETPDFSISNLLLVIIFLTAVFTISYLTSEISFLGDVLS